MREMLIELDVDPTDRRWQERANCLGVDPDLFFPIAAVGPGVDQIDEAKRI